ncbi:MAG: RluA family pseudouridine synthase [Pseudomonadota bacterium]
MSGVYSITVPEAEAGARLDRWFKRRFAGVTQGEVEKMLRTGQIRVDGARAKANTRLEAGQSVRIPPLKPKAAEKPKRGEISERDAAFVRELVVYEDEEMIALNKPAGLAVQGGTKTARHLDGMLDALKTGEYRPRLVHRLDRDTSGVLLLARTPAAAARLTELFRSRDMDKVYWAVTVKVPNPRAGQVRSWMAKGAGPGEDKERMVAAVQTDEGARHAITNYAVIANAGQRAAWVALKPETGRMHQLRFHMMEIGTSILGDAKYATRREVPQGVAKGLHLHARALIVPRKRGGPILIEAALPPHMTETFETLGFDPREAGPDPLEPFL